MLCIFVLKSCVIRMLISKNIVNVIKVGISVVNDFVIVGGILVGILIVRFF